MVSVVFVLINGKCYSFSKARRSIVWFIVLQVALLFNQGDLNFNGLLGIMIPTWAVFSVITLKDELKNDLFDTVYKSLAIILSISLVAWVLFIAGVQFPYTMEAYGVDDLYYFQNYRLFLRNTTMGSLLVFRFCSIFLEPGYLGCMVSLILYIRRYKMDFYGLVLLLSLFATFSLAGWILSLVGFLSIQLFNTRKPILILGIYILVFLSIWSGAKSFNGGDNVVNTLFFERLEYDEAMGTISGYDRSTEQTNDWFWSTFIKSPDILFGSSSDANNLMINDNDWKAYVVKHGIVGLSLFLLFAFYPFLSVRGRRKVARREVFFLSVLYVLVFAQTIHMIFSDMYVILLILGDSIIRTNSASGITSFNTAKKLIYNS